MLRLNEMPAMDLREAVRRRPVLLPAGCVEFHGNHLPLGTDTIIAEEVTKAVAARVDGVVAPTIDYGPTGLAVSDGTAGTIDATAEHFYGYAKDVLAGLLGLGFRRIFVIVHHQDPDGPEAAAFHFAQASLFNELHGRLGLGWWGAQVPREQQEVSVLPTILPVIFDSVEGDHAGRTETSLVSHLRPELVHMDRLEQDDFWYCWTPGREAATGSAAHGAELFEHMVRSVTDEVTSLL